MKVFRFTVLIIMFFAMSIPLAQAQDWGKVMTPDRPMNVRAGRSLNTDRVTTIMPGELVRMDFTKGDWSAVFPLSAPNREESAAIGYVKTKYMLPGKVADTSTWGKLVAPKGMLNIRKNRNRNSEHVLTLREGEVVRADFEKDKWVAVFRADESVRDEKRALGYAKAKYLFPATKEQIASVASPAKSKPVEKVSPPSQAEASIIPAEPVAKQSGGSVVGKVKPQPIISAIEKPTPQLQPEEVVGWGHVVTLKRRVNVRSSRTAGSTLVATLDMGAQIRVDFLERGWYAVFRLSEKKRDLKKSIGYIYAPLIEEPTIELNVHPLDEKPDLAQTMTQHDGPAPVMMSEAAPIVVQPNATQVSEVGSLNGKDYMTITPQDEGKLPNKGPIPRADRVRHGFKYGIIDRNTGRNAATGRLLIKVYVELSVIPTDAALRDFAKTLSKEEMGDATEMLLLLYLPGQDTKDLAYGQAKFDKSGLVEFWTRRSTLYGTPLLP